jgi:threonine/homoserine/homoserine lactone efflux protein
MLEALALAGTLAMLAAIPSASVALVIARSISHGAAHGITVGAGIVAGDLVFISFAMLGLSVIAEAMGSMFMLVKYLGALYLIWLGISLLRSGERRSVRKESPRRGGSFLVSFLSGLLLTLGDVKAIVFYLSLLPMFVELASLQQADVLLILAITVVSVGAVKCGYAVFAHRLLALSGGKRFAAGSTKAAGVTLVAAGSYLAVKA